MSYSFVSKKFKTQIIKGREVVYEVGYKFYYHRLILKGVYALYIENISSVINLRRIIFLEKGLVIVFNRV